MVVGKTLQTTYQNLFAPLQNKELFGSVSTQIKYTRGATTAQVMGREVMVMGSADLKAIGKIQGSTVALAYVDEATLLPPGFWDMLVTRLRVPGARMLATTNPGAKNHYLRKDWILKAAQKRMQVFSFKMRDNPSLTEEYIQDMERSFTGVFFDRYILGLWTNAEGAIFDMFDERRHVVNWHNLPEMQRMPGAGCDYGTNNASATGVLGWGIDNCLYICSEWRHNSKGLGESRWTDAQLSNGILRWWPGPHTPHQNEPAPEWLYVDPAAASLKTQLAYDGFYQVANADNEVVTGLRLIASLFAMNKLKISSRCPALIEEIPGYVWDEKMAVEHGIDRPVKKDDHSIDGGLRYPVVSTQGIWAHEVMGNRFAPAG